MCNYSKIGAFKELSEGLKICKRRNGSDMLPMLLEEQQETLICDYFGKLLTRMENCSFQICRYNELTHALNYCADFYQFISNL